MNASTKRAEILLNWLLDHYQEDRYVSIGCKSCKESCNIMASTAMACFLPLHRDHDVWMKNPFRRKDKP